MSRRVSLDRTRVSMLDQQNKAQSRSPPLSSAGRSLDTATQARANDAFGFDFSRVRVHPSVDSALLQGAEAVTKSSDIFFAPGAYSPESVRGRELLGHELAHVVQQSPDRPRVRSAPKATLESEADRVGASFAAGRRAGAVSAAVPGAPQAKQVTFNKRVFEVGDVVLNAAADTDIRTHGNLLPGADQAHVFVSGNQLGYEISHQAPEDPFRWNQLKAIVDKEHIDINGVALETKIKTHSVKPPAAPVTGDIKLLDFLASGITLTTLARQQANSPGQPLYVTSPDPARDKIYYETGVKGRGIVAGNALAHELFGHFALEMMGTPGGHGRSIPQSTGVRDPMGQPYVGSVNDYISNFAGAGSGHFESPTHFVSPAFLTSALADLKAKAAKGITGSSTTGWKVSSDTVQIWVVLSQNYRALLGARLPPTASPAPSPGPASTTPKPSPSPAAPASSVPTTAAIESAVTTWYAGLSKDQQWVFKQYLDNISWAVPAPFPPQLTSAIRPKL